MTEKFINELTTSPYYNRIFDGHDVIMISLTGSRIIDITDELSDYDLVVITNDKEREDCVSEFLTYYSKKVHWHYIPITKLIANEDGNLLSCIGEVEFIGLNEQKIIYANPKYLNIINFLIEKKNVIALVGAYGLVRFHDGLISKILNANEIKKENYCKYIYHLCFTSYVLLSETPNKNFLSDIKRIRWRTVSDEHKSLAVERIRLLYNFVAEHPLDLHNIIRDFNKCVNTRLRFSLTSEE